MDVELSDKQLPALANGNGTYRENGYVTAINNNDNYGFTNLPYSEPIDLQFKDITYSVNLGFNKGKHFSILFNWK